MKNKKFNKKINKLGLAVLSTSAIMSIFQVSSSFANLTDRGEREQYYFFDSNEGVVANQGITLRDYIDARGIKYSLCPQYRTAAVIGFRNYSDKVNLPGTLQLDVLHVDSLDNNENGDYDIVYIGNDVFWGCSFKKVIMTNVKRISEGAFGSCGELTTVEIPNVKEIKESAFQNCRELEEIVMTNVEEIGVHAFFGCEDLERIGSLDKLIKIERGAFIECCKLQAIRIPNIKELGNVVFGGCKSLREVVLGEGLEEIGANMFDHCEELKEIKIPNNVKKIGIGAFGAHGMNIMLPEGKKLYLDENYTGEYTIKFDKGPGVDLYLR